MLKDFSGQTGSRFGWDGVNLPLSSPYGAVFWIVTNCWWRCQCFSYCWVALTPCQGLSLSLSAALASRLWVGKRLWGDTAGASDPNWLQRCSIYFNLLLSNNLGGSGYCWGWPLICWWLVIWLALLVCVVGWVLVFFKNYFPFHLFISIYEVSPLDFCLSNSLHHPSGREWVSGWLDATTDCIWTC